MNSEQKRAPRRHDVDWLRVIAVTFLIMIHTAAIFDPYPITAVKGASSFPMKVFSTFVHEWRLAILFIVSGAGSYFALGFLTSRRYLRERLRRIVLPLVIGTIFIVPIHLYYWQFLNNPGYGKSYLQFNATIFGDFLRTGSFGRGRESLHWAHLWFLAYLFAASVVALPFFQYLRSEGGRRSTARLGEFFQKRWTIFLLAIPFAVIDFTLGVKWYRSRLIIIDDWAHFFFYLTIFVYGFIIFSNERIGAAVQRHRISALLLGILTSTAYLVIVFTGQIPSRGYNALWFLYTTLRSFNVGFWCIAIIGFGSRYLQFHHRVLPYANEAVYPVYILHLPIQTAIAYRVVQWNIGVAAQFIIIAVSTMICSVGIYELVIRRFGVVRFLFGLKPKRKAPLADQKVSPEGLPAAAKRGSETEALIDHPGSKFMSGARDAPSAD
jgi:peptidoglycan/LPS O-acetylase OafA/YrhL